MKDKAILKKWWFWVIIAIIALSAIGAATQPDSGTSTTNDTNSSQASDSSKSAGTLPMLNPDDYKGKEGLIVYKGLKAKGYTVDADFDKQALTDINGKASSVFEPLDHNKVDDKQSVDAFVVGSLTQDSDNVKLTIVQSSN